MQQQKLRKNKQRNNILLFLSSRETTANLDKMMHKGLSNGEEPEPTANGNNANEGTPSSTSTIESALLADLDSSSGIVPDAKSFATVLQSPFLDSDDETYTRLVEESISFGVYEGYLERRLRKLKKQA